MPSKTKTPPQEVDDFGLPIGVATFRPDQVAAMLSVTPRQLKRWRIGEEPILPAIHPAGPKSSPLYTRAALIKFLSK
jgi:hypothetical protein